MQVTQIALRLAATEAHAGGELRLSQGSEVVARVVSAPAAGGRGLISLAGHVLEAHLPQGLAAGRTISLRVIRADAQQVVVRLQGAAAEHDHEATTRLAGELALRGDGDLLRAALGLSGGTLWLPGGAAAQITVEADDAAADQGPSRAGSGEAAFVLHDPELGAIEVRLRMAAGAVRAGITTPGGVLADRASQGLPELVSSLERATGRPASAAVSERAAGVSPPQPPAGAVDVRA